MATTDLSVVTAHLEDVLVSERVAAFLEAHPDPLLAWSESKAMATGGGSTLKSKILTRGTAAATPQYGVAGALGRHKIELGMANLEVRVEIERDAVLAAMDKGNRATFDLFKEELDARKTMTVQSAGLQMALDGWGSLAGITAIASDVVTVGAPDESGTGNVASYVNRFRVGAQYNAANSAGSGNKKGADPGTNYTLESMDPSAGTLTFTAAVTDWADGDIISERYFRNFAASSGKLCVEGLESWLSANEIGGLTRTSYPDTIPLSYDATNDTSVVDAIIAADARAAAFGQSRKGLACLVSLDDFRKMQQSMEAKVHVVEKSKGDGSTYKISFSQFEVTGVRGTFPVAPSAWVPTGKFYLGPFRDSDRGFSMQHAGSALFNLFKDENSGSAIRIAPAGITNGASRVVAGYILEAFARYQLFCGSPGDYMVGSNLPTE